MVANFVGDVLFAEDGALERFVDALSTDHKRTFGEFIRDFIDWIKSKLGKIDEVTMLERKYAKLFKDAKKVESTGFFKSTESSYSVSPDLDSELDTVLNGTFDASKNEVYLGETSNFMTEIIGAEALSLYMPASKVYSALVSEKEYNKKPYYSKQDNYHGIGKADFIEILEKSETPIAAFAASPDESGNRRQNRIVLVTDKVIQDVQSGKNGYAVVVEEVDTKGLHDGKRVNANKTITIYPRTQLFSDIQNAIIDGRILNLSKKGEHLFAGVRGSNPQAAIRKDVLKKNIAHFWANVKWEKQKNKTFSTKEPELPSAFQLALEKAGYFDQDGHSKYMQENKDLSHDGDDSSYSYTPKGENGVDNYTEEQYNNFGWVRANNVINAGYWRNFTENFAQAVSGNYNYPKNKNGEFMIDVYDAYDSSGITDVIVFASGTIESPNVSKIIKINSSDSYVIEEARREIYALERRGIQQEAGRILDIYIKADILRLDIGRANGQEDARHNNRFNTKRSRSETKANRIVEFHIDEENGTVTTTYSNGEVVTENLSGQESSYSYTPTKSESFDELIKQYNEGLITEDEFKDRIVGRKSKDDPISVARMSEEAANTTPDIQRRQGKVKGDGEREFRDFCKNNKRLSVFQK